MTEPARTETRSEPRPAPKPTPETAHFWEGTKLGELRLQRCQSCSNTYFPPQPFCPRCSSSDIAIERATGRATLHTYVISHLPVPGVPVPNVLAVVELTEGPRLLTNVIGIEPTPDALAIDMALEVVFEPAGSQLIPLFRPATSDAESGR